MKTKLILVLAVVSFPLIIIAQDLEKSNISDLIDGWHKSAAEVDQKAYFDFIDDDGIYIGTDETEIWTKLEFYEWSKPYFEKGTTWNFLTKSRNIFISQNKKIAWFDELLTSRDYILRGSGVLQKSEKGDWKLKHYVLSLPVPNEKFKDIIGLINNRSQENKEREE